MDFSEIGQSFPLKTIHLYQLFLPLKPSVPFRTHPSLISLKPIIVEMTDLEDHVGYGSIDYWNHPFNQFQQDQSGEQMWKVLSHFLLGPLKKALMKPQVNPYYTVDQIQQICANYPPIAAGIEMAYWDLLIRKENIRSVELFWRLFFGEGRSEFDADDYDRMETKMKQGFNCKTHLQISKDFKEIEQQITESLKHNIYSFSVPIVQNLAFMVELIKQIRERFPEIILDTDANGGFQPNYNSSWEGIVEFYQKLDHFHIRYHEQPIAPSDGFEPMEKLAMQIKTPLGWDESLVDLTSLDRILKFAALNDLHFYLNWKVPQFGGFRNILRGMVKLDLHNQLYPTASGVSVPGFSFDMAISVFGMLALCTLPPKVSDCEYLATEDWCDIKVFESSLIRVGGQFLLSDHNGLGTKFLKNGLKNHILRKSL